MTNYWDKAGSVCVALICTFVLCWTYALSEMYLIIFAIWFIGEFRKHQTENSTKIVANNINTIVIDTSHNDDSNTITRKDIFDL